MNGDEPLEPRTVVVYFDLTTRDGKRAIEVRSASPLGQGYFASPRSTLYSCAYHSQAERILAFARARRFCDDGGLEIVHFEGAAECRAVWQ